mmetsp:Transcript_10959/g.16370  ORF Transcript_10959/g.16370 Transcript_10959/m.16370 type:complete len:1162 (+) Transcript_10959:64-3549(+)|eukprot:CAMPEP_0167742552 /NCGR_PEP_ID=MMETSP0110_2-20121227/1500_1 /TAXON_ID=629695 /ORGANISM="Gymnochlora sp., Strain CCMP2014" /LENGTH=1161 /DNA_ID=CAMNT_0007626777 /DNA_START=42 /DNA_END=3527 /DNA_ORIENTATION=+
MKFAPIYIGLLYLSINDFRVDDTSIKIRNHQHERHSGISLLRVRGGYNGQTNSMKGFSSYKSNVLLRRTYEEMETLYDSPTTLKESANWQESHRRADQHLSKMLLSDHAWDVGISILLQELSKPLLSARAEFSLYGAKAIQSAVSKAFGVVQKRCNDGEDSSGSISYPDSKPFKKVLDLLKMLANSPKTFIPVRTLLAKAAAAAAILGKVPTLGIDEILKLSSDDPPHSMHGNNTELARLAIHTSALEIAGMLPELVQELRPLTNIERDILHIRLSEQSRKVLKFLESTASHPSWLGSRQSAFLCRILTSWISSIGEPPPAKELANSPILVLALESLADEAVDEVLLENAAKLLSEIYRRYDCLDHGANVLVNSIITSVSLSRQTFRSFIVSHDDKRASILADVLVELGERWYDLVLSAGPLSLSIVSNVMQVLEHRNSIIASKALQFWYVLRLALNDPIHSSQKYVFRPYYVRLVEETIRLCTLPSSASILNYDPIDGKNRTRIIGLESDQRTKNVQAGNPLIIADADPRSFRYQSAVFLADACQVIGSHLVFQKLLDLLEKYMSSYSPTRASMGHAEWPKIESVLFSIRYLSNAVDADENVVIQKLLCKLERVPRDADLRYMTALLLGQYAPWIKSHPFDLQDKVAPILFSTLVEGPRSVARAAMLSLRTIVRECRLELSPKFFSKFWDHRVFNSLSKHFAFPTEEGFLSTMMSGCLYFSPSDAAVAANILIQTVLDSFERGLTTNRNMDGDFKNPNNLQSDACYFHLERLKALFAPILENTVESSPTRAAIASKSFSRVSEILLGDQMQGLITANVSSIAPAWLSVYENVISIASSSSKTFLDAERFVKAIVSGLNMNTGSPDGMDHDFDTHIWIEALELAIERFATPDRSQLNLRLAYLLDTGAEYLMRFQKDSSGIDSIEKRTSRLRLIESAVYNYMSAVSTAFDSMQEAILSEPTRKTILAAVNIGSLICSGDDVRLHERVFDVWRQLLKHGVSPEAMLEISILEDEEDENQKDEKVVYSQEDHEMLSNSLFSFTAKVVELHGEEIVRATMTAMGKTANTYGKHLNAPWVLWEIFNVDAQDKGKAFQIDFHRWLQRAVDAIPGTLGSEIRKDFVDNIMQIGKTADERSVFIQAVRSFARKCTQQYPEAQIESLSQ